MLISMISDLSGKENTRDIPVTVSQLEEWRKEGKLIQNIMPSVSSEDREFLMTGITPEEWNNLLSSED